MFRHPATPCLDAITNASSREAFADRQAAVVNTVRSLGLDNGKAILIGGAGLAASGIDTYIGATGKASTFDVDAIVCEQAFKHLQDTDGAVSRPAISPTEVHIPKSDTILPTSGIRMPLLPEFARTFSAEPFGNLCAQSTNINGTLALPPVVLARAKLDRCEIRDCVGVVKAQAIAWAEEHPVTIDQEWQWGVIHACNVLLRRADRSRSIRRSLPSWLGQLMASGFDHPAYMSLHPDRDTAYRTS